MFAEKLKKQIRSGEIPNSDQVNIDQMIEGLGDSRGLIRRTFIEGLGLVGSPALPALTQALKQHDKLNVRRSAAKALKLIGDPTALPDLLEALLNDLDPVVQCSSAGAMAIFGEESVELLVKVLLDPTTSAMQCGLASWGMAFIGADAPEALRKAAKSVNKVVRAAAISALGEQIQSLFDEEAELLVVNALNDESSDVRAEATTLISRLLDKSLAESLLGKQLVDSSPKVRKNAALSLMKLQAFNSIKLLIELSNSEEDLGTKEILKLAIKQLKEEQKFSSS